MRTELNERSIHYRLSAAYDCWGRRRRLARYRRNGLWHLSTGSVDRPDANTDVDNPPDHDRQTRRHQRFSAMVRSGRFSAVQLDTVRAIAFEGLTLREIAKRDGVTRQAVEARLRGNSRHQGGALRQARRIWET